MRTVRLRTSGDCVTHISHFPLIIPLPTLASPQVPRAVLTLICSRSRVRSDVGTVEVIGKINHLESTEIMLGAMCKYDV